MTYEEEVQQLAEVVSNPDYVTYCCLIFRPGVRAWMTEVELTKFRPGSLNNDDFHLGMLKWPKEDGIVYLVICFHKSEQEFAESILWKNGLRRIAEGFTQAMMTPGGKVERFPLTGPNIFFLENHTQGAPNVVYTNDPIKMDRAKDLEEQQCRAMLAAHQEWLKTPEGQAELAKYLKVHPDGWNT